MHFEQQKQNEWKKPFEWADWLCDHSEVPDWSSDDNTQVTTQTGQVYHWVDGGTWLQLSNPACYHLILGENGPMNQS